VNVNIRRRLNARDVSIQVIVNGAPPTGYQLTTLSVTPTNVTLHGSIDQLSEIGGVVNTLPVDVSQATSDLNIQVPLDLPPDVQATDSNGVAAKTVTAFIGVEARVGDLAITRPVELLRATPTITVTITPPEIDLLLRGPLPILNEIEANPNLVQVLVDTARLRPGQSANLAPEVIIPTEIEAQLAPPSVLVSLE
jgi:YbbR domain-containing protein